MKEANECTASRLLNGIQHIWGELMASNNTSDDEVMPGDDGVDADDETPAGLVEKEKEKGEHIVLTRWRWRWP